MYIPTSLWVYYPNSIIKLSEKLRHSVVPDSAAFILEGLTKISRNVYPSDRSVS
ncbi:hypothetical protein SVXHx_5101 (plasmid) [Haloferax volcanii]|nr:hypothetical protein SVXHx_5101 [Haloferax lucentense]